MPFDHCDFGIGSNKFWAQLRIHLLQLSDTREPLDLCSFLGYPSDESLAPDLSRGRGKSIGGDLVVDEEGFK
jgi:hypothetical protein